MEPNALDELVQGQAEAVRAAEDQRAAAQRQHALRAERRVALDVAPRATTLTVATPAHVSSAIALVVCCGSALLCLWSYYWAIAAAGALAT
ncbi:MAG: hypothetical protein R3B48_02970 [Kofleriaceae bacterium]